MRRLLLIVMLGWAGLAVYITTQPGDHPMVELINRLLFRSDLLATVGHGALFAVMTLTGYLGLRTWFPSPAALGLAMLAALLAGTGTEGYQLLVAGRDASLSDLLANWLGVFVAATVVSYRRE